MSPPSLARVCRSTLTLSVAWLAAASFLIPAHSPAQSQKFATQFALENPEVPPALLLPPQGKPWNHRQPGPVAGLQLLAREATGAQWLGSPQGAARFDPRSQHPWDQWHYFQGRRWLQDDHVLNIIVEPSPAPRKVWIRTQTGVSLIEWRPMTLEQKAEFFERRIEQRHVRHGLVADAHLSKPGDTTSSQLQDNDNDGLWTAIYLGAQAYRFAVTQNPEARARAQRAARALLRLESITGHPGFPARSILARSEANPRDGEWHPTADGQWLWKGDTSSDELVGHYFGYALYYDLAAQDADQAAVRDVIARITDHLISHDYDLIDLDGHPTRWGRWSEKYFQTEEGEYEAPLRSLQLLAFLKTAHHITGLAKYDAAYRDRLARGYGHHMRLYRRWPKGGEVNFSDDELAYLSYDPLLRYEKDSKLRKVYLEGLRFTWSQIQPDRNPLWNYISAASGAGRLSRALRDDSRLTLERIPMDLVQWSVRNSHRRDVLFQPANERHGRPQLTRVLAPDERPVAKWNSNPYVPDGGQAGHGEDDGAYFLLPYWMGRYHGWVR